jgi:hypothetical protein
MDGLRGKEVFFPIIPYQMEEMLEEENKWHLILSMAMPWLWWSVASLSPWKPVFSPRPVYVGFVMDKVALGQVLLHVVQLSPSLSFHPHSILIHLSITGAYIS